MNDMEESKVSQAPPIEQTGGYLYLNFTDNLEAGSSDWSDYYTLSLTEQYKKLKTKLGKFAPNTLQEFIANLCPYGSSHTYYISLPSFERQPVEKRGRECINNIVIRPAKPSTWTSYHSLPEKFDVILIGDLTFGTVIDVTIKGIELIDSKTAKFGEKGVQCQSLCAFAKKTFPSNGRMITVPDYGPRELLHNPILTHDFIDRLCQEVYPVPNPGKALAVFKQWQEYLRFRRYYLLEQSGKSEPLQSAEVIPAFIVSKRQYSQELSQYLLDGHKELANLVEIPLSKEVPGAEQTVFIRLAIEKNRKEILSETTGRTGKGEPKFEKYLKTTTRDSVALSSTRPVFNKNGELDSKIRPYLLGERLAFTTTDIEPDCSGIEKQFNAALQVAFKQIDTKYDSIIHTEVTKYLENEKSRLEEKYKKSLDDYIEMLKSTLVRDVEENNDKAVQEEYDKTILAPIRQKYNKKIEAIQDAIKKLNLEREAKKKNQKKKKKEKKGTDLESLQTIAEQIEENERRISELQQQMQQEIENACTMFSIVPFYESRNQKRIDEQRKSQTLAMQSELKKAEREKTEQLRRIKKGEIENEKKSKERELRETADKEIAQLIENETVRRYEIYFYPENPQDNLDDIRDDIKKAKKGGDQLYLTYDNRAEKAKIDRQEKALKSFLEGYVKNPYLISYLFSPESLASSIANDTEEPAWELASLNETQKKAVRQALSSESLFLLQGPPGTGKTQVIAEITAQLTKRGKKVLISSETHKAIDNVFERLPKIPEIRPLRLIPSTSSKESTYSPEHLVQNFYTNIRESLGRQVQMYENINETKTTFAEQMKRLRVEHTSILRLEAECITMRSESEDWKRKIASIHQAIESARKKQDEIREDIDRYERTKRRIEAHCFETEDVIAIFIEKYLKAVGNLLNSSRCFKETSPEDIHLLLTLDLTELESEIQSIRTDSPILSLNNQRNNIRKQIDDLRNPDTLDYPKEGEENYEEFEKLQELFIDLGKQISALKQAGAPDSPDGILKQIASPDILASPELLSMLPTKIREFRIKMQEIISELLQEIDTESEFFRSSLRSCEEMLRQYNIDLNEANRQRDEVLNNEKMEELSELSSRLKREITKFFRDFRIVEEYDPDNIQSAFDLMEKEWKKLSETYSENESTNKQRIPLFKEIMRYLDNDDILEEDKQQYTKPLYENANVFGITCTSRDRFTSRQLEELGKYGIDNVDIRTLGIDVVIIDEVSKSSFLDLLIPILYGKTVILVGDHRQLPPMYDLKHMRKEDFEGLDEELITYEKNKKFTALYEECFFKTLYESVPPNFKVMLNMQYRCHSDIMRVFNHFYGGDERGLKIGFTHQDDLKQHRLRVMMQNRMIIDPDHHIYFVDCNERESNSDGSTSKKNELEAKVVMALLDGLNESAVALQTKEKLKTGKREDERPSIGVICTYGEQAGLIKKLKGKKKYDGFSGKQDQRLVISTVDDFQGDERDIIIVSMVRNPKSAHYNAEFVKQFERINVAFSRARKLLIIVGAKDFLAKQTIDLPDLSGNHALDKHAYPVYQEIIRTIQLRGMVLNANEIIGD